ncbi:MAG TPA: MFS transporter, partial [Candidatus Eubacterium faecavium]|nr:MFS transporter [Candidatus Eubacterium faecavium]
EKIVQAKTHTIQIGFWDALKEVAKNKYFWIISLAGWLGFLEGAYGNILTWSYNYGHTASGAEFALIQTLTGNASLWGMLLAPLCIRKWGKKRVLLAINTLNVVFILAMGLNMDSIWWLFICVYFNWLVGAFEQITTPAIQADIRDYQQYKSGERIDGMFAAVTTIGGIITLFTSGVLPAVQEMYGIKEGNGYESPYDILDVTTGQPGLLHDMMLALIIMAAVGAFLNMVPYFFYDFTEKKQKSVVRVLQVRALFEDYGNNALDNHQIVEAIDMVEEARKMSVAEPKSVSKSIYRNVTKEYKKQRKNVSDKDKLALLKKDYKANLKAAKLEYREALAFNEEIDISKFVCDELEKFDSNLYKYQIDVYQKIYDGGIEGIVDSSYDELRKDLANAKAMPQNTHEEKEIRKFAVTLAKKKISAKKAFEKYYGSVKDFVEPDMAELTAIFEEEDSTEAQIFDLVKEKTAAKKAKNKAEYDEIQAKIKRLNAQLKEIRAREKKKMDEFAQFNRAAKPFVDARKLLLQKENYSHFEEIADLYDEAKINADAEDREKEELAALKRKEQEAELEKRKAEKALKKAQRSEKKSSRKKDK